MIRSRNPLSKLGLVVLVLCATVLGACDEILPKRTLGEKLYRKNCADCHGADGSGQTIMYMGDHDANLLDNSWKHGGGKSGMFRTLRQDLVFRHPSYDHLNSKELEQIVSHVLVLRGEKQAETSD